MRKIYLDNGSTSFPKAPGVSDAMRRFLDEIGCNVGRGGYEDAYSAAGAVLDTRELLCELFNFPDPKNVVFTQSVTYALNFLIKGFLKPGDHVLISSMEHNAVMRPLTQMTKLGVTFDKVPCDKQGQLLIDRIEPMIRPNTRAVFLIHASNVCGTLMPLRAVGEICRAHGLKLVVDAAQTAGLIPIDMADMNIDALAFTGHKSLLGPQGIGGFVITDEMAAETEPLITGGTGSMSDLMEFPPLLPDRFEAGTLNLPGIYGLREALTYLKSADREQTLARELALCKRLAEHILKISGARLFGPGFDAPCAPVLSADFTACGADNADLAFALDDRFGIMTRCGLHCAPSAHRTLGTFPQGTLRFSPGHLTTEAEIDCAARHLKGLFHKA